VNLKSVKDCWWWFVNGCWITGGVVSLGLGADYLVKYLDGNRKRVEEQSDGA
jgi:4-hydroxybenzoate polyprenyltransferase